MKFSSYSTPPPVFLSHTLEMDARETNRTLLNTGTVLIGKVPSLRTVLCCTDSIYTSTALPPVAYRARKIYSSRYPTGPTQSTGTTPPSVPCSSTVAKKATPIRQIVHIARQPAPALTTQRYPGEVHRQRCDEGLGRIKGGGFLSRSSPPHPPSFSRMTAKMKVPVCEQQCWGRRRDIPVLQTRLFFANRVASIQLSRHVFPHFLNPFPCQHCS
ncbi:hypothetical protein HOY82DRAFT_63275 [Tuber indicum]|nr:hypothetical protein HOY82DRAFT_63275 [Tuber indicum]